MTSEERRWRREERAEFAAEHEANNQHRPDCLCRAVRDWSDGPACYQKVKP